MADQLAEAGHEGQAVSVWDQSRSIISVPEFRACITAATGGWHDRRGEHAQAETCIRQALSEA